MSADPPLDPRDYPFTHQVRVRFAETDAMGVVHHGRYLPYLESARVEYLRHVGHPYTQVRESGIDFSVIEVHLRYRAPLRFDDLVDVHVGIGQMG
ncbi:MAG: acyl-CoA thioesterase, partial [Actinomycetales bacterium]